VKPSEAVTVNNDQLKELRKKVAQGEGLYLEFKRKATHPDKIVREIIALANTQGGQLLIGVDDDGSIPGVKYPEEEWHVVREALAQYCKPDLIVNELLIPLSEKKFVLQLDIPQSQKRPHSFKMEDGQCLLTFVRHNDQSIKASREMREIIRRSKQKKDIRFHYGEAEKQLMQYLEQQKTITLRQFQKLSNINLFLASRKLILLVLANVLKITPTEKGDLYSRV
jgi:predicted HTH transcriptional regulator